MPAVRDYFPLVMDTLLGLARGRHDRRRALASEHAAADQVAAAVATDTGDNTDLAAGAAGETKQERRRRLRRELKTKKRDPLPRGLVIRRAQFARTILQLQEGARQAAPNVTYISRTTGLPTNPGPQDGAKVAPRWP